ncbi:MAG: RluA family pseudouridine synthase [Treponema sp.]|jgi:23S rRNA pseudouridine1911/1915/1917 synthase|nr:RluA family pseudouridine synthase [Treponema sp.]
MPSFNGIVKDVPPALRLDRYVAEYLGILTRSQIKARSLSAKINGKDVKISREVREGDALELSWAESPPSLPVPENIPLDVLYEDGRVIVINKPQGLVVHPGAGNSGGTLVNALLYRYGLKAENGMERPGIVHRLDKDTSGVMIAARDERALDFLAEQFRKRKVRKTYAALVRGNPRDERGRIETFICRDGRDRKRFTVSETRGKAAVTFYRVIRRWDAYSLVLLRPKTGRTHQLRVHLRWLGNPVAGDPLYAGKEDLFPETGLMLHSRSLTLILPDHNTPDTFKAPMPRRFRYAARKLEGGDG